MKNGWMKRSIDEICIFRGGGTPSKSRESYWKGDIPWVSPKDMKSDIIVDSIDHISAEAIAQSTTNLIPANSILVVVRSGILARTIPVAITGRAVTINQDIKALCPDKSVDAWFLFYFLKSRLEEMLALASRGATVHRIMADQIRTMDILVPPLSEQRRIVGILGEAFDGIAIANANAEQNRQNARALFDSHLQVVFTQGGEGWVEKKLTEVVDANCSLSYGIVQPGDEYPDGMPVVRPIDLTSKVIRLCGLKRINPKLAESYKRTTLQGNELLLCVRGSTGVVSIASPELVGANVTRGIVPIRFARSYLLPEFGFYLISSGRVQDQIREKTYGAALMQINIRDLRNIALSVPPLKVQKEIATKLANLRDESQRLECLYQHKLAALDELKKSLLHQAFSGQL